jgi:uncharacterized protein YfiM (DUF2279 family)
MLLPIRIDPNGLGSDAFHANAKSPGRATDMVKWRPASYVVRSMPSAASPASKLTRAVLLSAASLCLLAGALLSPAPSVPETPPPSAMHVRNARNSALAVAAVFSADGAPRRVFLTATDIGAAASLLNYGLGAARLRARPERDRLRVEGSVPLFNRTWINLVATARSSPDRLPDTSLRVGRVTLPPPVIRLGLAAGAALARAKGADLPPLDSMVRGFAVSPRGVDTTLAAPVALRASLRTLFGGGGARIDPAHLRRVCGRIAAVRGSALAPRLRAAFANRPAGVSAVDHNKAAFVAVAMFAVDPRAGRLAGDAAADVDCAAIRPTILLAGRDDLAKHFALSAAMAAVAPPRVTRALGEWKELDDSLPDGSGFSFVDLAADRAGLHLGAAAVADEATAEQVAVRLAMVREGALLPPRALGLREGMSEAGFRARYGGLGQRGYGAAVRDIDGLLSAMPLYRGLIRVR